MPTSMENECVSTVTENIVQDGVVNAGTEIEIKAPEKCSWPNVLSVSIFIRIDDILNFIHLQQLKMSMALIRFT